MFEIQYIEIDNNRPFVDFFNKLCNNEQADILAVIDKFCEMKNQNIKIPPKISKFIKDGIFELRIYHKNKQSRCFYFFYFNQKIILTHGFIKKTNKVPKNEIEKAIKLKRIYILQQEAK